VLRRLGVRTWRDLAIFVLVLGYAVAILALMFGAIARDFGIVSFSSPTGRPIVADLTVVTMVLTGVMMGFALLWLTFALLSLRFRPRFLDPNSIEIHSPAVSILIPALDEERVVADLVRDLLAQDYPHLEVIVVAHNCSDRTAQVLAEIKDERLRVFELRTAEAGKALALNFGLARSTGDVIAQFDADNRVHDTQLVRRAVGYLITEPTTDAIQCRIETKNEGVNLLTRIQAVEYRIFSHLFWGGRNALDLPCPIGGTGAFFRRSTLERIGGWENELVEDYDLYCKLVLDGSKVIYKPDMVTWDEKPASWKTLIRQRSRWQRGHMEVLAKRWRSWMGVSDMMYLMAPFANAAWYASTVITLLYYVSPWGFSYWYPPAVLWVSLWIGAYAAMAVILFRTGRREDIRYLPAFFVYGFHWLVAFLMAFRVRGWSKTPHGIAR